MNETGGHIRTAGVSAAPVLAAIHALAFGEPWSEAEFAQLLASPGAFALVAHAQGEPAGFVLVRVAADEAEILTLAVVPAARRRGLAAALMRRGADHARQDGALQLFLEVAGDNPAARALYAGLGFAQVGVRTGYYERPAGAADALVLRLDLDVRP